MGNEPNFLRDFHTQCRSVYRPHEAKDAAAPANDAGGEEQPGTSGDRFSVMCRDEGGLWQTSSSPILGLFRPDPAKEPADASDKDLPIHADGTLDPAFETSAKAFFAQRKKEIRTKLQERGLEPGTPAFKKALEAEIKKPSFEPMHLLLRILDPETPFEKRKTSYFKYQALDLRDQATELALSAVNPGDAKKAADLFQGSAEAGEKAFALSSDPKDATQAALSYYAAGSLAGKDGRSAESRELFLRGATTLKAVEKPDAETLRLMGDGFREAGRYLEAVQTYNRANDAIHGDGEKRTETEIKALETGLRAAIAFCNKQTDAEQLLGKDYFNRLHTLERKQVSGKLTCNETEELKLMQKGFDLIRRTNSISLPTKPGVVEAKVIGTVRSEVLKDLTPPPDAKGVKAAEDLVKRLEAVAQTANKADAARHQFLSKYPPYVQQYIEETGDWAAMQLQYGYGADNHPYPGEWNPEALNDLPLLQAFHVLKGRTDPEAADKIAAVVAVWQKPTIISDDGDLKVVEDSAKSVESENSSLPEFGKLFKTGEEIHTHDSLKKDPTFWIRQSLQERTEDLGQIEELLAGLSQGREVLAKLEGDLEAAKKASDTTRVTQLTGQIDLQKKQLAKVAENAQPLVSSVARKLQDQIREFSDVSHRLGLLEADSNRTAYEAELKAASEQIARLQSIKIPADTEPTAALDTVTANLQALAGCEGVLLKATAFVNGAIALNIRPGAYESVTPTNWTFAQNDLSRALGKEFDKKARYWEDLADGKFVFSLDAAGIKKTLKGVDRYLRQTDQKMFEDLPTALGGAIEDQIATWNAARKEKGSDVGEYDQLIHNYEEAKAALKRGDTSTALALYKLAGDSRLQIQVADNFKDHQTAQMWKSFFIDLAITVATTALTAGTGALIARAVRGGSAVLAAGSMGLELSTTARVGLTIGEAALFVGFDKGIRGALHYGAHYGANPFKDADGDWLMPWDYGFEVAKMAAMMGVLHKVGGLYQSAVLTEGVMADAGTKAAIEGATALSPRLGRALLQMEFEAQVSGMGRLGKLAYGAGSFLTEAVALQGWNNVAAVMDTIYQNTVHGKHLDWTEELDRVNSPEAITHGVAFLAGLKLGGLVTAPIQDAVSAPIKSERLRLTRDLKVFEGFVQMKQSLEAKLTDPNSRIDPETGGQIREFIRLGDSFYSAGSAGERPFFTTEEEGQWREARTALALALRQGQGGRLEEFTTEGRQSGDEVQVPAAAKQARPADPEATGAGGPLAKKGISYSKVATKVRLLLDALVFYEAKGLLDVNSGTRTKRPASIRPLHDSQSKEIEQIEVSVADPETKREVLDIIRANHMDYNAETQKLIVDGYEIPFTFSGDPKKPSTVGKSTSALLPPDALYSVAGAPALFASLAGTVGTGAAAAITGALAVVGLLGMVFGQGKGGGSELPPARSGKPVAGEGGRITPRGDGRDYTVGRNPQSDLVLDDASISGTHFTLHQENGVWYVVNGAMGTGKTSLNGIFINGKQLQGKWTPIKSGDRISVRIPDGESSYMFQEPAEVAAVAAPAAKASRPSADPWISHKDNWRGIAAASDRGLHYKDWNEDRYVVLSSPDGRSVMVAIDGVGGHVGGERAAEVARITINQALMSGKSVDEAFAAADAAIAKDSRAQGITKKAPGAVAMAVTVSPNGDGTYRAGFSNVGDCEAIVIRPGASQPILHHTLRVNSLSTRMRELLGNPYRVLADGRLARGQTLDARSDEHANIVDSTLGGHDVKISFNAPDQPLRDGDIILAGSDGFFENFGRLDVMQEVIRLSGARTAAEIRDALMTETLVRMSLAKNAKNKVLSHGDYESAYREATGQEPPPNWHGMYEPWTDASGEVHRYSLDGSGNLTHANSGRAVDHFKRDNATVMVQIVGQPIHQ